MDKQKNNFLCLISWRKVIVILSVFTVLALLPVVVYLYLSKTVRSVAWYNSEWLYRIPIEVGNDTGMELTDEDILIDIDTEALIDQGKMKSGCEDIRFLAEDDLSELHYWVEGGCNTASTKVWVRVSTLPVEGTILYMYYGNELASSESLIWDGNVIMFADSSCPTGWTRVEDLDNTFLYGGNSYGDTGGSSSHSHEDAVCTSSSISTTNVAGESGNINGTPTNHTHDNLMATIDTNDTVLPPYMDTIVCYNNEFLIEQGLISMFNTSTPTGWTRFVALDSKFPRAASSYSSIGGNTTHTHTSTGGYSTGNNNSSTSLQNTTVATGGTITTDGDAKVHKFTSSGTFTANIPLTVRYLIIAGGGRGGTSGNGRGGGGAGGVRTATGLSITAGSKTITVGAQRANSSALGITATKGGDGGSDSVAGGSGGSGGGGGAGKSGGSGTSGQGKAGGDGSGLAGGGGGGYTNAGYDGYQETGGKGGKGISSNITGTALWYAGGGSGRGPDGGYAAEAGGTDQRDDGLPNTGAGGGGYAGLGGSGVVIIRYTMPTIKTFARNTHSHSSNSADVSTSDNIPPYLDMVFAKADSEIYVTSDNVITTTELPPLGWNRFTELDDRLPRGAEIYGGTEGSPTHTHSVDITTGGPSATIQGIGTGTNYADSTHTHSCNTSSNSVSNYPPYTTVIFAQRKASQDTIILEEEMDNSAPERPSQLLTEGLSNPTAITTYTPKFSAIFLDDEGDEGIHYQIEINTEEDFTGTIMWDTGKSEFENTVQVGDRSEDIIYAGESLQSGLTYYWRMKFWDLNGEESEWSRVANFRINNTPLGPSSLLCDEKNNPVIQSGRTPEFSAIFSDPDPTDAGEHYQIQVSMDDEFIESLIWDSEKIALDELVANGSRIPNIVYDGDILIPGERYYWRIRVWDNNLKESDWSETKNFTVQLLTPTSLNASSIGKDNILWTISDPNTNTVGYKIYDQNNILLLSCLVGQMSNCKETSLLSNTTYSRKVRAYNNFSESELTSVYSVTTLSTESSINQITVVSEFSLLLDIQGSTRDRIQVNEVNGGTFVDLNSKALETGNVSFPYTSEVLVEGLIPNTIYTFKARSLNQENKETKWSSSVSEYTLAQSPTINRVNRVSSNSVRVFINNFLNPLDTEFMILESNSGRYVDFNTGLLSTTEVWGTYANFGGVDGILITGLEVGQQYGFVAKARNKNMIQTELSNPLYIGTSAILRNVDNRLATVLASDTEVDVTLSGNGQFGTKVVRVKEGQFLVADVPVLFNQDRDWSDVLVLSAPEERKAVVKMSQIHGVVGPYTMYVVQGESNAFVLCPNAQSLEEVSIDCNSGIKFTEKFPQTINYEGNSITVSQASIGGVQYWIADGLTGMGGYGYIAQAMKEEPSEKEEDSKKDEPKKDTDIVPTDVQSSFLQNMVNRGNEIVQYIRDSALGVIDSLPVKDMKENELRRVATTTNVITITVGTTAILGGLTQLTYSILQFFTVILSSIGFRKKRVNYGFVYDSNTKEPVHMALVRVYNKKGRLVETAVTDINGRFSGSLNKGKYELKVSKSGYEFPSIYIKGPHDYPIQNIYTGELDISSEDAEIQIAVPIDPKEILGGKMIMHRIKNIFLRVLSFVNVFIFLAGVLISSYTYYTHSNTINLIILLFYILPLYIFVNSILNSKGKYGKVVDEKGKSLSGIAITIREKEFNKVVAKRITNSRGKYRFILDKGKYELDVAEKDYDLIDIKRGTFIDVRKDNFVLAKRIKVKKV